MVSLAMNDTATSTKNAAVQTAFLTGSTRRIVPGLLGTAALLLLISIVLPYWHMHLQAPQFDYRGGLNILVYVNKITGNDPDFDELRELNGLNHYIGMRPLDEAALLERAIAIPTLILFVVILAGAAYMVARQGQWRWSWVLTLGPLGFPVVFVADLYYWMRDSGMNLDPHAPLSSTIRPFIPNIYGEGVVAQFTTTADFGIGWYLSVLAGLCILAALVISALRYRSFGAAQMNQEEIPTDA